MFRLEVNSLAESWAISGKVISESVIRPDKLRLIADLRLLPRMRGRACAKPPTIVLVLVSKGLFAGGVRVVQTVACHVWWGEAPELPEVLPEVPSAELEHYTPRPKNAPSRGPARHQIFEDEARTKASMPYGDTLS